MKRVRFASALATCAVALSAITVAHAQQGSQASQNFIVPIDLGPTSQPGGFIQPVQPGLEKTSCCIPETYGSVCVQGYVQSGAPANEDECVYNQYGPNTNFSPLPVHGDPGIYQDPDDGQYYQGRVFDTNQTFCSNFCGERFQFYWCVNRDRGENGGDAECAISGDPRVTEDLRGVERGYLSLPDGHGGDVGLNTCLETCPADTCQSCDILTDAMDNRLQLSIRDDDGRTQFCNQSQNSCTTARSNDDGRIICVQKPKCTSNYIGICDKRTFTYMVTSTDTEQAGTPVEMQRFLNTALEDGSPNPDYADNVQWVAPAQGGLDRVDELLDATGLTRNDATIDLGARGYVTDPLTEEQTSDYQLRIDANLCKPRYSACCDYIDYDGDGNYGLYISEADNAPVTPAIQSILDRHGYASYVPYRDINPDDPADTQYSDDDSTNDIQACLDLDGYFATSWLQQERRVPNNDDLNALNDFAQDCHYDYTEGRTTSESRPQNDGCYACTFRTTQEQCVPRSGPVPPYCRWVTIPLPNSHTGDWTGCVMNDLPVSEGGHPQCQNVAPTCKDCYIRTDESSCTSSPLCAWTPVQGDPNARANPQQTGVCGPRADRCNPVSSSSSSRPAREYLACNRTIGRRSVFTQEALATQCFKYDPDSSAVSVPNAVDPTPILRTQLLRTHVIMFDVTPPGQNICSNNCTNIDLFSYRCDAPTGILNFDDNDIARTNRDVTFQPEDDGNPPATAQADCNAIHQAYLRRQL
jgi:hypothetical protein